MLKTSWIYNIISYKNVNPRMLGLLNKNKKNCWADTDNS